MKSGLASEFDFGPWGVDKHFASRGYGQDAFQLCPVNAGCTWRAPEPSALPPVRWRCEADFCYDPLVHANALVVGDALSVKAPSIMNCIATRDRGPAAAGRPLSIRCSLRRWRPPRRCSAQCSAPTGPAARGLVLAGLLSVQPGRETLVKRNVRNAGRERKDQDLAASPVGDRRSAACAAEEVAPAVWPPAAPNAQNQLKMSRVSALSLLE
jgi:hypothetical protein